MDLTSLARHRLAAAATLAARVAERPDPNVVHDFRVAARRLQVLLGVLRGPLKGKRLGAKIVFCRRAERILSKVRDRDVVLGILRGWRGLDRGSKSRLTSALRRSRGRRLQEALTDWSRLDWEGWKGGLECVLPACGSVRPAFDRSSARFQAGRARRAAALCEALTPASSQREWHELRKSLRELRYAWEDEAMLAGRGRDRRIGGLIRFQRILGDARDMSILAKRAGRMAAKPGQKAGTKRVLASVERGAAEAGRRRLIAFEPAKLKSFVRPR